MKLSNYARKVGVRYETAWRWFKAGKLPGYQMDTGTIIISDPTPTPTVAKVAIYTRVSSGENKAHLETQAERLLSYCAARGYQVHAIVKEIGSGLNEQRPKFMGLLSDTAITVIVVEHRDRATRFGAHYIETLLQTQGRRLEVVNLADTGRETLVEDFAAVIYSFCARLYGTRRAKRKTTHLVKELQSDVSG